LKFKIKIFAETIGDSKTDVQPAIIIEKRHKRLKRIMKRLSWDQNKKVLLNFNYI